MNKSKAIQQFLFLFLFVLLLPGCTEESQKILPSGKQIKVGVIGPMSGPDQNMGKEGLEGIQTALHIGKFLHNGDAIELLIEDDQNIPELTVKAFEKLVVVDQVRAVIFLSSSESVLAVNDIADTYQVPVLVLLATHADISKETKFVSQLCLDNTFQGKVAALYVRDELLIDQVAVFKNPTNDHSNSLANEFIRKFRAIEGEVVDVVLVPSELIDYAKVLAKLRGRGGQFLYLPVRASDVLLITEELHNMGWNPGLMGGDSLLNNVIDSQEYLDGFLQMDHYSSNLEATSLGKQATQTFRSLFDTRHSTYPASGFEGMAILRQAMDRCQKPADSVCINSKIRSTRNFEGIMGKITVQEDGKVVRPLIINRVDGKKLEYVVKVY